MRFWVLLALLGCSEGASTSVEPPRARTAVPDGGGMARAGMELQSFNGQVLELIGERDVDNRYASAVMVTADAPSMEGGCSGVLLHPRLVLTAGHCVCTGKDCAKHAQVTTILHVPSPHSSKPTIVSQSQRGEVRLHPEFERHANLAVILLEKPLRLDVPEVLLPSSEVQVGERLVMAGFGHEKGLLRVHGARYFKKGKVTRVLPSEGGTVLFAPEGPYLNTSYSGGPCFREGEKSRGLVGIVGLGTDQEMSFTSTYFHRDWLRAELQHAEAAGSGAPLKP